MSRLRLQLLGGFQLRSDTRSIAVTGQKVQALLAYLALHPGRPHSRDALAALLWGGSRTRQARQSLRQAVFRLKRALAAGKNRSLGVRGETVTLDVHSVDVDVSRFERLARGRTRESLE